MKYALICVVLTLWLAVQVYLATEHSRFQPTDYGVGLSLSLDYAFAPVALLTQRSSHANPI